MLELWILSSDYEKWCTNIDRSLHVFQVCHWSACSFERERETEINGDYLSIEAV